MIYRLINGLAALILLATTVIAFPECPRELQTLLTSAHCSNALAGLSQSPMAVRIDAAEDACSLLLHATLSVTSSLPCTTSLRANQPELLHGRKSLRRLSSDGYFNGKLKCKFTSPQNATEIVANEFVLQCEEIHPDTGLLWLWIVIGCLALPAAIWLFFYFWGKTAVCLKKRRERKEATRTARLLEKEMGPSAVIDS